MAKDFESDVLQRLTRIEEKVDASEKKHSEHFKYRNEELAPRLAMLDEHERKIQRHDDGHDRWRIGAGLAIIGAYLKGMF